jgi:hypothetical protein
LSPMLNEFHPDFLLVVRAKVVCVETRALRLR